MTARPEATLKSNSNEIKLTFILLYRNKSDLNPTINNGDIPILNILMT